MPDEPAVNFHGFLRTSDGRFERVDAPPHKNTIAQRILPDGTILGCLHDDDFGASMKGAVLSARDYSETDAFASMHNGATPDLRRIVGLYNYAPRGSECRVRDRRREVPAVSRPWQRGDVGVGCESGR
jgi:hypothetical protein